MNDETKVSIEKIESIIANTKNKFLYITNKFKSPERLDIKTYVWVVFTGNIVYKSEDLITILKRHREQEIKIKSPLYILSRSILEDLFYMRFILVDKNLKNIDKRFNAYVCSNLQNNIKHLTVIKRLEEKGKFIYEKDDSKVLSDKGLSNKLIVMLEEIENINSKYTNDAGFKKITESFKSVEEVCKRYDEIKNINKVEQGKEQLSLEWVYNYLYRFKSMYTHQSISPKEDVIDCIWRRKSYQNDNEEVLNLLVSVFETIEESRRDVFD